VRLPLRNRRLLAVFALAAACAGLLAAWATASTRAHRVSATAVFRNDFVTFRHPAAWSATVWKEQTLHFEPMVYLSTAGSGHDPCRTSTSETGTTTACGWPIGRLAPNGVLVKWENRGAPGAAGRFSGTITRVGGRLAHLSVERPGACRGIGADETISV